MDILPEKFHFENVSLDYCFFNRPGEALYVFFNGAQNRSKPYPNFNRVTWNVDFPGPCLYICDPILAQDENLTIGWYTGGRGFDVEKAIDSLVLHIKSTNNIQNIISWGSSAGGYASLRLAGRMKGVTSVAVNPQTDIFKYYKGHVQRFLTVAFPDGDYFDMKENGDFNVFRKPCEYSKYIIYQNIEDDFHYNNHYLPMIEFVKNENITYQFESMLYTNPAGHGPEKRDMVPEILNFLNEAKVEVNLFQ